MELQNQDDTRNAPMQIDFNASLVKVGEQIMALYEQFLPDSDDKRTFKVKGSGREIDIKKEDLKNLWQQVIVRSSNRLARDMRANMEDLKTLWKDGLFGDPSDAKVRRKVMEMYEFGNLDGMFEDEDLDTDWSQEENDMLLDPETPLQMFGPVPPDVNLMNQSMQGITTLPVQVWEDHRIHSYNHNNLRKSKEYREASPEIKARIDAHCDWTMSKLAPPAPITGSAQDKPTDVLPAPGIVPEAQPQPM
jgi:DNA-binding ferritin-like protein (Dps family)